MPRLYKYTISTAGISMTLPAPNKEEALTFFLRNYMGPMGILIAIKRAHQKDIHAKVHLTGRALYLRDMISNKQFIQGMLDSGFISAPDDLVDEDLAMLQRGNKFKEAGGGGFNVGSEEA